MALPPLATTADLASRDVDITDADRWTALLNVASSAIRDAAGSAITSTTATAKFPAPCGQWLELPGPVTSVDTVKIDGVETTDYTVQGDRLWRCLSWQDRCRPPQTVEVTFTFGLAEAPADIVDLTCSLARLGNNELENLVDPRLQSVAIDDYKQVHAVGADVAPPWSELPERTRAALRRRFASTAYVTGWEQ